MTEVYLALGSNVGDSKANLKQAANLLKIHLKQLKQAPIYTSQPAGYTDQPDFLNTAVSGQTNLSLEKLFKYIKEVEKSIGRIKRFKWGPREIDIDIIFFGDKIVEDKKLTVPHPRFRERDFVLQPLADLNPDLVDPVSGRTMSRLLASLGPENRTLR